MPKANELDLLPEDQRTDDRILVIANPDTGEMFKIPVSVLKALMALGGGGGSARFGVSGEDDTASQTRSMNMAGNMFALQLGSKVDLQAGDWDTGYGNLIVGTAYDVDGNLIEGRVDAYAQSATSDSYGGLVIAGVNGLNLSYYKNDKSTNLIVKDSDGFLFETQYSPTHNQFRAIDQYVFKNTAVIADTTGGANVMRKTIVAVRSEDDFANDAAAASGSVPVGGFYHTSGVVKMRLA